MGEHRAEYERKLRERLEERRLRKETGYYITYVYILSLCSPCTCIQAIDKCKIMKLKGQYLNKFTMLFS